MPLHTPVLLDECLDALALQPAGVYLDCTFGRGGHSRAILDRLNADGRLLALDQDPQAIASAAAWHEPRLQLQQRRFDALTDVVTDAGCQGRLNGILFDLGVSSPQLDDATRGFSFMHDGPLDMRMNTDSGETAAQWLARAKEQEIADVIYQYGEERHSRRIARAIVGARGSLTTTRQLAELIAQASPSHDPHKHPATRSFQAIRIFINRELDALAAALPQALDALALGGRLAVISFHSLEDRIVKRFLRDEARGGEFPLGLPVTADQFKPRVKLIGKAISASGTEVAENPRARSAVLRVAEKIL